MLSLVGSCYDWLIAGLVEKIAFICRSHHYRRSDAKLDLCSALIARQEGFRYMLNLMWHGTSVLDDLFNGRPHSRALYVKTEVLKIYPNYDLQRLLEYNSLLRLSYLQMGFSLWTNVKQHDGSCQICLMLAQCFYKKIKPRRWHSNVERLPRKQKVGCSNSSRDRPKS